MADSFDAAREVEKPFVDNKESTEKFQQDSRLPSAQMIRVQRTEESCQAKLPPPTSLLSAFGSFSLIDANDQDITDTPAPIAKKPTRGKAVQPLVLNERTFFAEKHPAAEIRKERENLLSLAKAHGLDTKEFAKRMDELQRRVPKDIAAADVANTYKHLSRLLESSTKTPPLTSQEERAALARQILTQAAEPGTISQGTHNTCGIASIESVIYTRHPAKAAAMLADLALSGKFTGAYGVQLQMNPHPQDFQGTNYNVMRDGARTYASELFQLAAVNLLYKGLPMQGDLRYEQSYVPPEKHGSETGEGLYKYENGKRKKVADNPLILPFFYGDVEYGITGVEVSKALMGNAKYLKSISKELLSLSDSIAMFTTEAEFEHNLAEIKAHDGFPIILSVNTGNEPFVTDNPASAGLPGDQHAITIRDYLPGNPSKVLFDNEWCREDNHDTPRTAVTVHQLYLSTFRPKDSSELLQKDVVRSNKNGHPDSCAELEQLRLGWISGKLDTENFTSKTIVEWDKIVTDIQSHKLTKDAMKRSGEKIETITKVLPMHASMRLVEKLHDSGAYNQKDFSQIVESYAIDLVHRIKDANLLQSLELAGDYIRLNRLKRELPEAARREIDNAITAEIKRTLHHERVK